jgi:hypothetical protein
MNQKKIQPENYSLFIGLGQIETVKNQVRLVPVTGFQPWKQAPGQWPGTMLLIICLLKIWDCATTYYRDPVHYSVKPLFYLNNKYWNPSLLFSSSPPSSLTQGPSLWRGQRRTLVSMWPSLHRTPVLRTSHSASPFPSVLVPRNHALLQLSCSILSWMGGYGSHGLWVVESGFYGDGGHGRI